MNNEVVLDIETKKSFQEVGGAQNMRLLGVSVVGTYSYADDTFRCFEEKDFVVLEELLKNASRVVGFNSKHFDFPVLSPHLSLPLHTVTHLDLMEDIEKGAGFRVSLDNLARANLGVGKSGHGLEAIQWWREGKIDAIKQYCLDDVRLTRDLYEYGKKSGGLEFDSRDRGRVRVPVYWQIPVEMSARQHSLF